jgi:hypothetical protein
MDRTLAKARKKRATLTLARLKDVLSYDPATGMFTWLVELSNKGKVGTTAGYPDNGYILIGIDTVKYQAHVLAWFYMTGVMPEQFIDHEDGDGQNNRWGNLREAERRQNNANSRLKRHNTTGFKGVTPKKGKFAAQISRNGVTTYLGLFDKPEDAHAAYMRAAAAAHGKFARPA